MNKTEIIVVDDHPIMVQGVKNIIEACDKCECIATATNGKDALKKIQQLKPDIVITDLNMPGMNGIELIKKIKRKFPDIGIIVISVHQSNIIISSAITAGALGYIDKSMTPDSLQQCIETVKSGKIFAPSYEESDMPTNISKLLSKREVEIAFMLVSGMTPSAIGKELNIQLNTVSTHKGKIYTKLGVSNTTDFSIAAELLGIVNEKKIV